MIGAGVTVSSIGIGTVFISEDSLNDFTQNQTFAFGTVETIGLNITIGMGITVGAAGTFVDRLGNKHTLDGYFRGVVTEVPTTGNAGSVAVKLVSRVSAAGTVTDLDYAPGTAFALDSQGTVGFHTASDAVGSPSISTSWNGQVDWFQQQKSN